MKVFAVLSLALAFSSAAQAESVSCTLSSEGQSITVTNDFATMEDGYMFNDATDYVYDLSHSLEGNCTETACDLFTTLASLKMEDEFSQYSFEFPRGKKANVLKKTINHKRDNRIYEMSCDYQP